MTSASKKQAFTDCLATELKWQVVGAGARIDALAAATGEAPSTVSLWLNTQRTIRLRFVYTACRFLGVHVADLFRMAERRLSAETPLLMTGILERHKPAAVEPKALRESGVLFVDCVAAELRVQLEDRGISVWQAGPATGHSRVAAGQWLRGERAVPVQFAFEVCALIGLEIGELADLAEARMSQFEQSAATASPQGDRRD